MGVNTRLNATMSCYREMKTFVTPSNRWMQQVMMIFGDGVSDEATRLMLFHFTCLDFCLPHATRIHSIPSRAMVIIMVLQEGSLEMMIRRVIWSIGTCKSPLHLHERFVNLKFCFLFSLFSLCN